MTAELSPDDLAAIKRKHVDLHNTGVCYRCEQLLPCDAVRLLDEVERLRGLRPIEVCTDACHGGQHSHARPTP